MLWDRTVFNFGNIDIGAERNFCHPNNITAWYIRTTNYKVLNDGKNDKLQSIRIRPLCQALWPLHIRILINNMICILWSFREIVGRLISNNFKLLLSSLLWFAAMFIRDIFHEILYSQRFEFLLSFIHVCFVHAHAIIRTNRRINFQTAPPNIHTRYCCEF